MILVIWVIWYDINENKECFTVQASWHKEWFTIQTFHGAVNVFPVRGSVYERASFKISVITNAFRLLIFL